jgi:hypothetical protein
VRRIYSALFILIGILSTIVAVGGAMTLTASAFGDGVLTGTTVPMQCIILLLDISVGVVVFWFWNQIFRLIFE